MGSGLCESTLVAFVVGGLFLMNQNYHHLVFTHLKIYWYMFGLKKC